MKRTALVLLCLMSLISLDIAAKTTSSGRSTSFGSRPSVSKPSAPSRPAASPSKPAASPSFSPSFFSAKPSAPAPAPAAKPSGGGLFGGFFGSKPAAPVAAAPAPTPKPLFTPDAGGSSTAAKAAIVGGVVGTSAVAAASADQTSPSGRDTGRAASFGSNAPAPNAAPTAVASVPVDNKPKALFPAGTTSSDVAAAKQPAKPTAAEQTVADFKARNAAPVPTPTPVATAPAPRVETRYISRRAYTPPVYVNTYVHQQPYYGAYDALLLWALLDNNADRNFYYNHRNEPSFQQWKMDAQALCNQGNTQVCQQLASLDASAAQMAAQNAPVNANYVPQDVEAQPVQTTSVSQPIVQAAPKTEEPTSFAWLWWTLGLSATAFGVFFYIGSRR